MLYWRNNRLYFKEEENILEQNILSASEITRYDIGGSLGFQPEESFLLAKVIATN